MKIPIIFLGTSQAIPTTTRNHTAILIKYKNENILIDCGEGTQRQFRKAKINPCKLTRILITHWHGDHVLGLPGLFQTLILNGYKKTLYIYGPKGTKKYIKEFSKIFQIRKLKIKVEEVNGKFLQTPDFEIHALPLKHGCPCNGYSFKEKQKLRIDKTKLKKLKIKDKSKIARLAKGKTITINNKKIKPSQLTYKQPSRKITFILDTKINPNINKLAKDSELLIIESTYSKKESALASKYGHLTTEQTAKIAKKAKVKKLILTHLSQRYEFKEKALLKEAKKIFPNTTIAKDFMRVEV
jgi:ribonuclease Z